MIQIISIEFEYKQNTYFALVRIKERHTMEYHVTIMNGSLEKRLYGNHIFVEEDGELLIEPITEKDTNELRRAVGLCYYKVSILPDSNPP